MKVRLASIPALVGVGGVAYVFERPARYMTRRNQYGPVRFGNRFGGQGVRLVKCGKTLTVLYLSQGEI